MARKQDTLTTAVPPPTFNLAVPCGNTTFPSCKATCSLASCCFVASVEDNCFVENEPLCGEYASTCAPFFLEGEESFGCLDKINAQRNDRHWFSLFWFSRVVPCGSRCHLKFPVWQDPYLVMSSCGCLDTRGLCSFFFHFFSRPKLLNRTEHLLDPLFDSVTYQRLQGPVCIVHTTKTKPTLLCVSQYITKPHDERPSPYIHQQIRLLQSSPTPPQRHYPRNQGPIPPACPRHSPGSSQQLQNQDWRVQTTHRGVSSVDWLYEEIRVW